MCGISVTINCKPEAVEKMSQAIKNRGTSTHFWQNKKGTIHLAYEWLPIVTHNQKEYKLVENDRFIVWLNGYISNYKELAEDYGITLKNESDTELILALASLWAEGKIKHYQSLLNGFFNFVVYYKDTDTIEVNTDRHGIKKMYSKITENEAYFCSEVKGILAALPHTRIDPEQLAIYMSTLGVMNFSNTIYWDIDIMAPIKVRKENPKPFVPITDYEEAKEKLQERWLQSINRNIAPFGIKSGVFLSGGIDSGMIARHMPHDYEFSMDYINPVFSEINGIKANSNAVHFTMIDNEHLMKMYLTKAIDAVCDPRVGSCYTNYALTDLASKRCTILYSGAGSDELFDGYPHRKNKPLIDVINRSNLFKYNEDVSQMTLHQYNMQFLSGVLTVEDRMTGAFAMESRYPFLDNDFVDFVLSLPMEFRANKRILKEISGLSDEVLNAPKRGFSNPLLTNDEWTALVIDRKMK